MQILLILSLSLRFYNHIITLLYVNEPKNITKAQTLSMIKTQCEMFLLFICNGITFVTDIFIRISFLILIPNTVKLIHSTININLIKITYDSNSGDTIVFASDIYMMTGNNILFCCY